MAVLISFVLLLISKNADASQTLSTWNRLTCAVTASGKVDCWGVFSRYGGRGNREQLGERTIPADQSITSALAQDGVKFTSVAVGDNHICMLG